MISKIIIAVLSFGWVFYGTRFVYELRGELINKGTCKYCYDIQDFLSKVSDRDRIFLFTYDLPGFINFYLLNSLGNITDAVYKFKYGFFLTLALVISSYFIVTLSLFMLLYFLYTLTLRYLRSKKD